MAREAVPAQHLKAGEEYLAALQKLGLIPEFLGWGLQIHSKQWMLIMVTSVIEIGGPLALNELLFRAYNMKATPQEISPFIVRVYGPKTMLAPELRQLNAFVEGERTMQPLDKFTNKPKGVPLDIVSIGKNLADFHIEATDVYLMHAPRKVGHEQRTREWLRFKGNVERLAA